MTSETTESIERLLRERELYRGLLELDESLAIEPFLGSALRLIVEVTGAEQGYIEMVDPQASAQDECWWTASGCSEGDVEQIRELVSRGVIAESVATGEVVVSRSAVADPRFRDRSSVRRSQIRAVLCAPIGPSPPLGVVYLQRRTLEGDFTDADRRLAEIYGKHLSKPAQLLLERRRRGEDDPTRPFREQLRLAGIVGCSPALAALLRDVTLVSPLDVCVLLTGETGTGKSRFARVIHDNSPRASGPFVEINCAGLPETLLESELFGAVPGAHSTATRRIEGKVAAARGGTLFLDEIGELSLGAQAKLLQLLQSKQYYPLGASRAETAEIRVLAATNTELHRAVTEKRFREDLFYRLQVLPIRVPSIAERREDLPLLAAHFCETLQQTHRLAAVELSPGALDAIVSREWHGNVRELGHAVEAAVIRAAGEGCSQVEIRHLGEERRTPAPPEPEGCTLQEGTRRYQAGLVKGVLESSGWNVSEAARRLDVTRAHVYNLIKNLKIARG